MSDGTIDGLIALRDSVIGDDVVVEESESIAAAGNGGVADASANGGAVGVGDILSGGNAGGAAGVGDVYDGAVAIEAADVSASTALDISANGGVGVADASGGDENFAATVDDNGFAFVS